MKEGSNFSNWSTWLGLLLSVIAISISVRTCKYVEDKDQSDLRDKTKIVMCEVGQIIHFTQSSDSLAKTQIAFNESYEELNAVDPKGIDDALLSYLIDVRAYFKAVRGADRSDGLKPSDREQILKDLSNKYDNLLKEFNELKKNLERKYEISINC